MPDRGPHGTGPDDAAGSGSGMLGLGGNDLMEIPTRTGVLLAFTSTQEGWCPPFEMSCEELNSAGCTKLLQASSVAEMVAVAQEHGAFVHGFTPVWYNRKRLTAMATAITRRLE